MKTHPRAPHFLRVTQALAFVSGLGTCFVGCGGQTESGEAEDASSSQYDTGVPLGVRAAPDAARFDCDGCVLGVSIAPDAAALNDASGVYDGPSASRDAAEDASQGYDGFFAGSRPAPSDAGDVDATADAMFVGGGIGPAPEDASKKDAFLGILIAPEGGAGDARADVIPVGGPLDPPDLPVVSA